jgi:hypothetical protein
MGRRRVRDVIRHVREITPTGLPSFPIPPPAVISVLTKPGQTIVMLT